MCTLIRRFSQLNIAVLPSRANCAGTWVISVDFLSADLIEKATGGTNHVAYNCFY